MVTIHTQMGECIVLYKEIKNVGQDKYAPVLFSPSAETDARGEEGLLEGEEIPRIG